MTTNPRKRTRTRVAARLVVQSPNHLTEKGVREIAAWLRRCMRTVHRHRGNFGKTIPFTYHYAKRR